MTIVNCEPNQSPLEPCATLSSPYHIPLPQKKGYTYVPHYHNSLKDISSNISRDNITTEPRIQSNPPKVATPPRDADEDLYLNKEVLVKQAFQDPNESKHWKEVMDKEFESLTSKKTGTLVPPLSTDKVIGGMWRLVQKKNKFGKILKYKARWVFFRNHQEHMVNYYETYSAVARLESFKILPSLMVNRKYSAYQFDVETAFLYGEMDAPNYLSQAADYEVPGKETWVWKLNKSLYRTKQAPRQCKAHLVSTLRKLDLVSADTDECLFFNTDRTLFLHIHVDDAFIIGETAEIIENFLTQLSKLYSIKTNKKPSQHLGYTLSWQQNGSVILHQQDFCSKILEELNISSSNSIITPAPENIHNVVAQVSAPFSNLTMQKEIGMLNFLTLHTRPNIMFTTNLLSQFTN
ncbi:hypothetical protein O181_014680 [Austropuccinia psidii MF-1]|uniref:Reverse transcriptase Ty1/copia-type domain-containing protein n=1 Tax=Austropuccinia psidii MF-1 TaxID=1389203 RepID=A0A9Q3C1F1_9BASI|nr:hypothetical protein [Austropuccinia psidii MF-1]